MPYTYHTEQEEQELRALTTLQLAKKNNRHLTGALIYAAEENRAKHEEAYDIIRDELAARDILSNAEEKRLIDGKELA